MSEVCFTYNVDNIAGDFTIIRKDTWDTSVGKQTINRELGRFSISEAKKLRDLLNKILGE